MERSINTPTSPFLVLTLRLENDFPSKLKRVFKDILSAVWTIIIHSEDVSCHNITTVIIKYACIHDIEILISCINLRPS